jgi:DNA ligase D-like protein (predicted 3'-phosphoesterase)
MIKGLKKLHAAEPACRKRSDSDHLKFVINKKNESGLKFDFAIELDGIKNWAVPDEPSMNPLEQRMAREAKEIHERVLNFFEKDEPVSEELWDKGNYIPLDEDGNVLNEYEAHLNLKNGSLRFFLQGSKLVGVFILIKKGKKNWLLIKQHDEFALYQEYRVETLAG